MTNSEIDIAAATPEERRALLDRLVAEEEQRNGAPLSFGQLRLWYQSWLAPESSAYNVCRAYLVRGPMDLDAFRAAWHSLAMRQSVLRTTFVVDGGVPAQRVHSEPFDMVRIVDLAEAGDPQAQRARAQEQVDQDSLTPFDLETGPLVRCTVYRTAPEEAVVSVLMHHVVTDGWSMPILFQELAECYAAALDGREPNLPALKIQYVDYVRREVAASGSAAHQARLERWRDRLATFEGPVDLPTDWARTDDPAARGGMLSLDWGATFAADVARVSREHGATPYMVVLAGVAVWLGRLTGQRTVVVGTPVSGRTDPDVEGLVGFFVNTAPVVIDLHGVTTFVSLLERVRAAVLDTFEDQDVPLEQIIESLDIPHGPARNPLFDVMLVMKSVAETPLDLCGTSSERLDIENLTAKFDFTLGVETDGRIFEGWVEYNSDLFQRESAAVMLDQVHTVLRAALAEPETTLDDLPLTREAVAGAVPTSSSGASTGPDAHEGQATLSTVPELVRHRAATRPDSVAVDWDGDQTTYGELVTWADSAAAWYRAHGVAPGAPVAVRSPAGGPQLAALLGAMTAGSPFLGLDPDAPLESVRERLADLRPACLVNNGGRVDDDLVTWYRSTVGGAVLDVSELLELRDASDPVKLVDPPVAEAPAYVVHTSGSTGRAVGMTHAHGPFAEFVEWMSGALGMGAGRRVAQWAAPGYDAAYCEAFATLVGGGQVVAVPAVLRADATALARWLRHSRVDVLQTVPSFARELRGSLGRGQDTSGIDTLVLAGERLPGQLARDLLDELGDGRLVNLYGPTETVLATWHEVRSDTVNPVPIGTAIPGREVEVLDERGRACPLGVTGEIVISGSGLALGYRDPQARPGAFETTPDGRRRYRTGDLGRRRWDGVLEFRARVDDLVKVRGTRLELGDLEASLGAHPSVASCAVLADVDEDGLVQDLTAYVVARTGQATGGAAHWRAHLRSRFADGVLPSRFVAVEQIPRNAGGKVDRAALTALAPAYEEAARPSRPATPTEQAVAATWTELLGVDDLDPDLSFFAAGGNSLLAPRMLHLVYERLGVEVPLRGFFADPTIAGLGRIVDGDVAASDDLDDLMREIESLSDDEATRLLTEHRDGLA